ncbi:MAG: hypothetical protein KAR38_17505, partial [Calditrichia bacterium]|nr:hypothetical protein [Calditrichia bacterium]
LAIRVEFQEDNNELTTGDGTFNLEQTTPDSINIKLDPPPHNKSFFSDHLKYLKNYFKKVSYDEIEIEYTCYPADEDSAYQLPQQMTYYNPNTTREKIDEGLAQLFYDSWSSAAHDPEIDFDEYNCFFIFHAGVGKDIAMIFDETSQDIPSLYITPSFLENNLPDGLPPLPNNMEEGAILPETESQDDYELALNGLVVSNFATFLGLPDMFNAHTQKSAVGIFDLMDVGLFNGQGLLPSIPMAWHRINYGWDTAVTITSATDSLLQMGSFEQDELNRIYKFPITSSEYFLVEMRAPGDVYIDSLRYEEATEEHYPNVKEILLGHYSSMVEFSERGVLTDVKNLDMGIPGNGILIWHVDDNVINTRLAANEPINNDQNHKGIDLEEADGSQDIGEDMEALTAGSGSENGWLLDMFYSENNAPMYENNNGSFSLHTIPASTSNYMNGNSHLTLSNFSNADTVMSFKADFELYELGFPVELLFNGKVNMIKAFSGISSNDK